MCHFVPAQRLDVSPQRGGVTGDVEDMLEAVDGQTCGVVQPCSWRVHQCHVSSLASCSACISAGGTDEAHVGDVICTEILLGNICKSAVDFHCNYLIKARCKSHGVCSTPAMELQQTHHCIRAVVGTYFSSAAAQPVETVHFATSIWVGKLTLWLFVLQGASVCQGQLLTYKVPVYAHLSSLPAAKNIHARDGSTGSLCKSIPQPSRSTSPALEECFLLLSSCTWGSTLPVLQILQSRVMVH
mmetsp:Transcript_11860/g.20413  ORF Transcript_11860/g.20413 Transcript_11860/m.20413 type:complete len:242 (-) Transcript_11860:24-749(-)